MGWGEGYINESVFENLDISYDTILFFQAECLLTSKQSNVRNLDIYERNCACPKDFLVSKFCCTFKNKRMQSKHTTD